MRPHSLLLASALAVSLACAPPPDSELSPAAATAIRSAVYAGRTSDPNLFAAVITNADGVEAYLCDGRRDFWFRGGASGNLAQLEDDRGAKLVIGLDDDRVAGAFGDAAGTAFTLTLPKVDTDVLFRAEGAAGETSLLGGWIRLPDGEQRGVIRVGDQVVGSTLDSSGRPICQTCGALGGLEPAPFTPTTAQRRPNVTQRFTMVALGDSYISGEGAPVLDGSHDSSTGAVTVAEDWSDGLPKGEGRLVTPVRAGETATAATTRLAREARACHRGASGAMTAIDDLKRTWSFVEFVQFNAACSGARTTELLQPGYTGPGGCGRITDASARAACFAKTDDVSGGVQSQLSDLDTFLGTNRVSLDAMLLSVGGNDLGFGDIMADCLGGDCARSDSVARGLLASNLPKLPPAYLALKAQLDVRGVIGKSVHLAQYPSPLRKTGSSLCSGLDFSDTLMKLLSSDEATFAASVHDQLNGAVRAGATASGWRLVSSHIGREAGHGACTAEPWFNDTQTALRTQGSDLVSPFPGVNISAGMAHPNRKGHEELYQPAFLASLTDALTTRFTPKRPNGLRVTAMAEESDKVSLTLTWNDVNTFEMRSFVDITVGGQALPSVVVAGADRNTAQVEVAKVSGASPLITLRVRTCFDGISPRLCSEASAPLDVEVKVPSNRPQNVLAFHAINPLDLDGTVVDWSDSAPAKMFTTLELNDGTSATANNVSLAVEASRYVVPSGGYRLPNGQLAKRLRLATCNSLGCGGATGYVDLPALPTPCLPPRSSTPTGCR